MQNHGFIMILNDSNLELILLYCAEEKIQTEEAFAKELHVQYIVAGFNM